MRRRSAKSLICIIKQVESRKPEAAAEPGLLAGFASGVLPRGWALGASRCPQVGVLRAALAVPNVGGDPPGRRVGRGASSLAAVRAAYSPGLRAVVTRLSSETV